MNQVLQSDVSITKRSIPPGHVCHYKIHLDQQSSNFLDPDSIWMTQLLVKKPSGRKHIQNDKLQGDLIWYTRGGENGAVDKGHSLSLLGEACSQAENSCTRDVAMNRKFFVEENRGSLDSIYLVLVNDASLNDPKETQSFTAKFSRIETSFASSWYFWSSAAWILISSFFLVLIA